MDKKDFNGSVTAEIPAKLMENFFRRLENEETPHCVTVRKGRRGIKHITICCDAKDVVYFNTIVTNEIKAKI